MVCMCKLFRSHKLRVVTLNIHILYALGEEILKLSMLLLS
jgi:hypothetical protein